MSKTASKPTPAEDERFLKGLTKKQVARRKRDLAAIHTGKRQLGLSDAEYRDLLEAWTGRRSARYLRSPQRGEVLENMRAMGFKKKGERGKTRPKWQQQRRVPLPEGAADPEEVEHRQHKKIVHLWHDLYRAGKTQDASMRALCKFCKRQTGIQHVRWLVVVEDANVVIESLKKWLAREEKTSRN